MTAQEAELSGEVAGSVTARVTRLRVLPSAVIHGDSSDCRPLWS